MKFEGRGYAYIFFAFLIMLTVPLSGYAADCLMTSAISLDQTINASLDGTECSISDIRGGNDASYYDLYSLTLTSSTEVTLTLSSSAIDTYLELATEGFLTNPNDPSNIIAANDDADASTTNSEINACIGPGSHIIMANSWWSSAPAETGPYTLIVSNSTSETFIDVDNDYWAFCNIEALAASGITSGCGNGNYCPENPVTRAQMAVFLERGMRGSSYVPDPGVGNIFQDVPPGYWAGGWIELLSSDGITAGCGNDNYCPDNTVTREQMAVFLLRAKYGKDYAPPTPTGVFSDVVLSHWSAGWIEQLAAEGITGGCGNGNYCPKDPVTRAQMAVFLVKTFGL